MITRFIKMTLLSVAFTEEVMRLQTQLHIIFVLEASMK